MHTPLLSAWDAAVTRPPAAAPLVSPVTVLEHGPAIHVLDLRPAEQATGIFGYIPGSTFVTPDRLASVAAAAGGVPLALVSTRGQAAAESALALEQQGVPRVAAIDGGIAGWRAAGFGVSRDPAGIITELHPIRAEDASSGTLSLEQVRTHIGDPRAVRWIQADALAFSAFTSCVDGRDPRAVVGTPGGDAGELVVGMAAVEEVTGRILTDAQIHATLEARLDRLNTFYLHSDAHAIDSLATALRADSRTADAVADIDSADALAEFLVSPPPEIQEALLEHLVRPENVGCGHLRLMLQHPEEYRIRPELVAQTVRSFCRLLWQHSAELRFVVLQGGHAEGAVVNIRLAEEPVGLSLIPVVSPSVGGVQMFINHADVTQQMRRNTLVNFFSRGFAPAGVDAERAAALSRAIEGGAAHQLTATLGHLAKGLPIYDVTFARDASFEVSPA